MNSSKLKAYELAFSGFPEGMHDFSYTIHNDFLTHYSIEEVYGVEGEAAVRLEKKSSFFKLYFNLQAKVVLHCDRCTEPFTTSVENSQELVVKFGVATAQDPEDIVFIAEQDNSINIAHFLYEFLTLSIPMKRVHEDLSDCSEESINFIHNFADADEGGDPRWAALKHLKF